MRRYFYFCYFVLLLACTQWSCSRLPQYYVFKTIRHTPKVSRQPTIVVSDTLSKQLFVAEKARTNLAEKAIQNRALAKQKKQAKRMEKRLRLAARMLNLMPKKSAAKAQSWVEARRMVAEANYTSDSTRLTQTSIGSDCVLCGLCQPLRDLKKAQNMLRVQPNNTSGKGIIAGCVDTFATLIRLILLPFLIILYVFISMLLITEIIAIVTLLSLVAFGILLGLLTLAGVPVGLAALIALLLAFPLAALSYSTICRQQ